MKLYDLAPNTKIVCKPSDGSNWVIFSHLDGMYSYCVSQNQNVIHLRRNTPLQLNVEGEWVIDETE